MSVTVNSLLAKMHVSRQDYQLNFVNLPTTDRLPGADVRSSVTFEADSCTVMYGDLGNCAITAKVLR